MGLMPHGLALRISMLQDAQSHNSPVVSQIGARSQGQSHFAPCAIGYCQTPYCLPILYIQTVFDKGNDMAKASTYQQLGKRVQQTIASATAKDQRHVYLEPREEDSLDDWDQLIEEISTNENVEVNRTDDGRYLVSWNPAAAV